MKIQTHLGTADVLAIWKREPETVLRLYLFSLILAPQEQDGLLIETLDNRTKRDAQYMWALERVSAQDEFPHGFQMRKGEAYLRIRLHLFDPSEGVRSYHEGDKELMRSERFDCPLSFLRLVPPVWEPWRAKVREHHGATAMKEPPELVH